MTADAPTTDAPADAPQDAPEAPTSPPEDAAPPEAPDAPEEGAGSKRQVLADLATERKKRQALQAELDQLREAQMTEQEKAVAEARKAGESDALSRVNSRIFTAEAKALAAGKIADPSLLSDPVMAQRLLGFDDLPLTPEGDIDAEVISGAIDRLLQDKPYLAATAAKATPTGSADQGARGGATPSQLTRDDLKSMTPQQIRAARDKGLLNDVLGIKP